MKSGSLRVCMIFKLCAGWRSRWLGRQDDRRRTNFPSNATPKHRKSFEHYCAAAYGFWKLNAPLSDETPGAQHTMPLLSCSPTPRVKYNSNRASQVARIPRSICLWISRLFREQLEKVFDAASLEVQQLRYHCPHIPGLLV